LFERENRIVFLSLLLAVFLGAVERAPAADFYISTLGNDQWTGTLPAPNATGSDGPFATIGRAQLAVRQILLNPQGRTAPILVQLRKGIYYQSQSLSFGTLDSGTEQLPVIWGNYPAETPIVSGGRRVTGWTNVSGNEWQASLPASTQNFEQLFYRNQRRLRPRVGSTATSNLGTYYRVAATVYLSAPPPPGPAPDPNCSVYVPGSGWQCFDRFQYSSSDPIVSSWKNLSPPAGNPCNQASGNPNLVGDIELVDFEIWTASKMRVSCVDPNNRILYLTGPTLSGVFNGFLAGHRYLIENVQDELLQPGQWFLNRAASAWTLTYLANSGENPNTDLVIIPQVAQVLVASNLSNVTFQGITFQNDNFVVPAAGYQSTHSDPYVTTALSCQNCSNVVFDSDTITQTSGGGLEFISCVDVGSPSWCVATNTSAMTVNNTFENGALYDIGAMGIRVGMSPSGSDTDSNVPQFTTVKNTVIEGVGRVFPSSLGIAQGTGHDNLYNHNDIYDSYHSAIAICEFGCNPGVANSKGTFNNEISFNHVYNLMQGIMSDMGALYINTGSATFVAGGNKILNNKVHDVVDSGVMDPNGYGGFGVLLDQNTGLVEVENNLVYRTSDTAVRQTCGTQLPNTANTIKNNILALLKPAIENIGCPAPNSGVLQFTFTNNLVLYSNSTTIQRGCVYCAGGSCPQSQKFSSNLYCQASSPDCSLTTTPFVTTDSSCTTVTSRSWSSWQGLGEDLGSIVGNPLFVDPYYPTDDYTLQAGSPAGQVGFVPFDVNAPGRTSSSILPPAVAPTFTTAVMVIMPAITLTANLNPSTYGQPVTFTATASSSIGPPPDGDLIAFTDTDSRQILGTGALSQGIATITLSSLASQHTHLQASYSGNGFWPSALSNVISQLVNEASTSAAVNASPNPSVFGQSVTLTATVSSSGGIPPGTVQFKANGNSLGTGTLNNGVAKLTTTAIPAGAAALSAYYEGDSNFLVSTSPAFNQTVSLAASASTVASNLNPSKFGQSVTFTATVTSPSTVPTGSVVFKSGTATLGSIALNNGVAKVTTTSLKVGTELVTANYQGNNHVLGSTSAALSQVVTQTGTNTVLTSKPNPAASGQTVTLVAAVSSKIGGSAPTGTVTFLSGATVIGKANLVNGTATFATTFSGGIYLITADYSGNANYIASAATLTQTVN